MAAAPKKTEPEGFLKPGALINLDRGGRTLQNLEILDVDSNFLKVRWDIHVSPNTEIALIPIDGSIIGLVGER
jgi:hypothetical protein